MISAQQAKTEAAFNKKRILEEAINTEIRDICEKIKSRISLGYDFETFTPNKLYEETERILKLQGYKIDYTNKRISWD